MSDRVLRTVYRHSIKLAKQFDDQPVLKALITRNAQNPWPEPLDGVVSTFLAGRSYYWPSRTLTQSVVEFVQNVFRFPPTEPSIDGAFQSIRYLTGILNIAKQHGIATASSTTTTTIHKELPSFSTSYEASTSSTASQLTADQILLPEQGALLVAHPCLSHWFNNSVVLICNQTPAGGSYGLCLNKPLGTTAGSFLDKASTTSSVEENVGLATISQGAAAAAAGSSMSSALNLQHLMEVADDMAEPPEESSDDEFKFSKTGPRILQLSGNELGLPAEFQAIELELSDEELKEFQTAMDSIYDSDDDEFISTALQSDDDAVRQEGMEKMGRVLNKVLANVSPAASAAVQSLSSRIAKSPLYENMLAGGSNSPGLAALRRTLSSGGDFSSSSTETSSSSGSSGSQSGSIESGDVFGSGSNFLQTLMKLFAGSPLYRGGPIPGVQLLHCKSILGGEKVLDHGGDNTGGDGVFVGAGKEGLTRIKELMDNKEVSNEDVRLFLGDSGWGPMQLESELELGAWTMIRIPKEFDLFDPEFLPKPGAKTNGRKYWETLLAMVSPEHAALSAIPPGVWHDLQELQV